MVARVLTVFGTRPEAIKMAPVVRALQVYAPDVAMRVCVTAQHREMLDQVLSLFGITPNWDLDLMQPGQNLTDLTCRVIAGLRPVLQDWRPDIVLVQGDTTTAFAAALAAFYERITVGHVEAGLRTGDRYAPWPEEVNRRLIAGLATWHFAPTERAKRNLLSEGVSSEHIWVTGNTVIDALLDVASLIRTKASLRDALERQFGFLDKRRRLILVTGHRRENFGSAFEAICRALNRIACRGDVEIVYPVHRNPNVQDPVRRLLGNNRAVHLLDPLDYLPFVALLDRACVVITDSGGIQEEAPSLGKPVLVTREITERPEAVDAGTVRLVGADEDLIVSETARLLDIPDHYEAMARAHNPYGDGNAGVRIARSIVELRNIN